MEPLVGETEFRRLVHDLAVNQTVQRMQAFVQHGDISCLEHCALVSYYSFRLCRALRLDYRSAARAGLLHDLFLYDWHIPDPSRGLHAFAHPRVALENAGRLFQLNARERDIILKHMWPLTPALPRYRETLVVSAVDKLCAFAETARLRRFLRPRALLTGTAVST